ncbi:MAG: hypothetical protein HYY35_05770 [Deltaproteobacteria bacterium]|nr:hypothetical protein [Deltaproteobacteria bacterium]
MERDGDSQRRLGLCAGCRFARRVRSAKGSEFLLCGRSELDRAFPRYPRLPVVRCGGFESDRGDRR